MKPRKKNRFFTFIFSFCPGAAEMYMGFMKNGFSILAAFLAVCGAIVTVRADFLLAVAMLFYCYGFFHARNVAGLDDASFATYEDKYIWEEFVTSNTLKVKDTTVRKWVSIAMILVGAGIAWNYLSEIIYSFIPGDYWNDIYPIVDGLPSLVVAIVLIIAGAALIRGKKRELTEVESNA